MHVTAAAHRACPTALPLPPLLLQRAGHPDVRPDSPLHTNPYEFRYLTEFQSHEPEFDYLKSLEIEEKINKVRWVRGRCGGKTHMLLTTNDKTVKLWKVRCGGGESGGSGGAKGDKCRGLCARAAAGQCRRLAATACAPSPCVPSRAAQVYEKKVASLAEFNLQNGSSLLNAGGRPGSAGSGPFSPDKLRAAANAAAAAPNSLRIPRVVGSETLLATRCKRAYANAHTYHINSIALSSDCETFISADDLRVNLWHLDRWVLAAGLAGASGSACGSRVHTVVLAATRWCVPAPASIPSLLL